MIASGLEPLSRLAFREGRGGILCPRENDNLAAEIPEQPRLPYRPQHGPRMEQVRVEDDGDAHGTETTALHLIVLRVRCQPVPRRTRCHFAICARPCS